MKIHHWTSALAGIVLQVVLGSVFTRSVYRTLLVNASTGRPQRVGPLLIAHMRQFSGSFRSGFDRSR
jgi:hypothetical protein